MKFDVVVMNPPYQDSPKSDKNKGSGTGNVIWNKFVESAINDWTSDDGIVLAVHPSGWRKPESERSKYSGMFKMMAHDHHMKYLEIHDAKDGVKTFGAGTRYDWYVIDKGSVGGTTNIKDQNGIETTLDMKNYEWLPNHSFDEINALLGDGSGVIYKRSNYGSDKKWTSKEQSSLFMHPLIHSTTKKGIRYYYSSRNDNGFFGLPKVIFGASGLNDVVIDMEGKYGMTEEAMALPVESRSDAQKAKEYLLSPGFKNVLNACSWSNFRIDWRMFTYFKEGFWRDED